MTKNQIIAQAEVVWGNVARALLSKSMFIGDTLLSLLCFLVPGMVHAGPDKPIFWSPQIADPACQAMLKAHPLIADLSVDNKSIKNDESGRLKSAKIGDTHVEFGYANPSSKIITEIWFNGRREAIRTGTHGNPAAVNKTLSKVKNDFERYAKSVCGKSADSVGVPSSALRSSVVGGGDLETEVDPTYGDSNYWAAYFESQYGGDLGGGSVADWARRCSQTPAQCVATCQALQQNNAMYCVFAGAMIGSATSAGWGAIVAIGCMWGNIQTSNSCQAACAGPCKP